MTDKDYGWPTTRCFPRTLDEAWPNDNMNNWWEDHKPVPVSMSDIVLYACTAFFVWVAYGIWSVL